MVTIEEQRRLAIEGVLDSLQALPDGDGPAGPGRQTLER